MIKLFISSFTLSLSWAVVASVAVLRGAVDTELASDAFFAEALVGHILVEAGRALLLNEGAERTVLTVHSGTSQVLEDVVRCASAGRDRTGRLRQTRSLAHEARWTHHAISVADCALLIREGTRRARERR